MFERFSQQARGVVARAAEEARGLRSTHIGTEHLLLAMLDERAGVAYAVLHGAGVDRQRVRTRVQRLAGTSAAVLGEDDAAALKTIGIDLDAVLARIEASFGAEAVREASTVAATETDRAPRRRGLLRRGPGGALRFTPRARKVIGLALREAIRLGDDHMDTGHVLLGVLREGEGLAAKVLTGEGHTIDDLRASTLARMGREEGDR